MGVEGGELGMYLGVLQHHSHLGGGEVWDSQRSGQGSGDPGYLIHPLFSENTCCKVPRAPGRPRQLSSLLEQHPVRLTSRTNSSL
jgi:hypothetical protein